jgi:hypothetical protein
MVIAVSSRRYSSSCSILTWGPPAADRLLPVEKLLTELDRGRSDKCHSWISRRPRSKSIATSRLFSEGLFDHAGKPVDIRDDECTTVAFHDAELGKSGEFSRNRFAMRADAARDVRMRW